MLLPPALCPPRPPDFQPKFCPRADCPSHTGCSFTWRHDGRFWRKCDQRFVQRFHCRVCERGFSVQTFRFDYRFKRPDLPPLLFIDRISKVTHRQSARVRRCARTTEERHFRRLTGHCQAFHDLRLKELAARGGLGEMTFLLDELETYEHHRRLKPLTVPVLIAGYSGFVIDARVGTLAPRGRRTVVEEDLVRHHELEEGKRKSESRKVVREALERLLALVSAPRFLWMLTDEKPSYGELLRKLFGKRCIHFTTPSRRKRDSRNPLFEINHTLARVRDNVSRLVRENWGAAKKRVWLAGHLAIWTCYRNYIRGRTNKEPWCTPAMALGVQNRVWSERELLGWRIFPDRVPQRCEAVSAFGRARFPATFPFEIAKAPQHARRRPRSGFPPFHSHARPMRSPNPPAGFGPLARSRGARQRDDRKGHRWDEVQSAGGHCSCWGRCSGPARSRWVRR